MIRVKGCRLKWIGVLRIPYFEFGGKKFDDRRKVKPFTFALLFFFIISLSKIVFGTLFIAEIVRVGLGDMAI